jgi:hypothetical protein
MRSTKSLLHRANTSRLSEVERLITGTAPILLDAHDAGLLLGVTGAGIERMVSDGRLEDMTLVGERRYFRASQSGNSFSRCRFRLQEHQRLTDHLFWIAARLAHGTPRALWLDRLQR